MADDGEAIMPKALSAADFAKKIDDYATKTVQSIAKNAAGAVFTELATLILQATPVLTGHARHNWIPTVGDPATQEIDGVAGVLETGADLTGDEQSGIDNTVKQFLADASATRLVFSNNAPYIGNLDQGSSQKAPAGILEPSVQATLAMFKDGKIKVTRS